jgi:RNA recognition motif-containing protein
MTHADWDESRGHRVRRSIFVGNLHSNVTMGDLRRHVEAAARLTIADRDVVIAPGYALVTLPTESDAARLVASGLPALAGRPLVVKRRQPRAQPRPPMPTERLPAHIVLGNVPAAASDFDVELHIAAVAPVARVGLPRDRDGQSIGVAFVVLQDAADAPRVVRELDGVSFIGRTLRCTLARGKASA